MELQSVGHNWATELKWTLWGVAWCWPCHHFGGRGALLLFLSLTLLPVAPEDWVLLPLLPFSDSHTGLVSTGVGEDGAKWGSQVPLLSVFGLYHQSWTSNIILFHRTPRLTQVSPITTGLLNMKKEGPQWKQGPTKWFTKPGHPPSNTGVEVTALSQQRTQSSSERQRLVYVNIFRV